MGTRGITKVIKDGQIRIAQYGQWDHYPSGQGITALEFLKTAGNVEKLENNLDKVVPVILGPNDMDPVSREVGAGILEIIANLQEPINVYLDIEFEKDELFCEGVYTIDFDNKTFITKYDGNETILSFDEIQNMSQENYLIKTKCPVYAYENNLV
jgi:hypothetical protein